MKSIEWGELIPPEQQEIYRQVIQAAGRNRITFAVGGAVARTVYTRQWRNTKDLDIYVMPDDRRRMIEVLGECGLEDFHDQLPYDRRWIYRGFRNGVLVDVIWAMANQRCRVDAAWISGGPAILFLDEPVQVVPPEELIWAKLYVMQRDRCDWPDILNIIDAGGADLDWPRLLARVGDDRPLLEAVLTIYAWLRPDRARAIPPIVRNRLGNLPALPSGDPAGLAERLRLLDGRPWFGPEISIDGPV